MRKKNIKNRINRLKKNNKPSNIKTWLKIFPDLTEEEKQELDGKTIDEFIDDDYMRDIIDDVYDYEVEAFEKELIEELNK